MFQISFGSDKGKLEVRIDSLEAPDAHLRFAMEKGVFTAPFMATHLNGELRDFLEAKVRLAYERGYKDGQGHKKKATGFWGDFDLNPATATVRP